MKKLGPAGQTTFTPAIMQPQAMNAIDQNLGQKISLVEYFAIQATVAELIFSLTIPGASVLSYIKWLQAG